MNGSNENNETSYSYGAIEENRNDFHNGDEIAHTNGHHYTNHKKSKHEQIKKKQTCFIIIVIISSIIIIILLLLLLSSKRIMKKKNNKNESKNLLLPPPNIPETFNLHTVYRSYLAQPTSIWNIPPPPPPPFTNSDDTKEQQQQQQKPKMYSLPTNSWYQNLFSHTTQNYPSPELSRIYTTPYMIDMTPPSNDVKGIRIHHPMMRDNQWTMQVVYDWSNGLSLGLDVDDDDCRFELDREDDDDDDDDDDGLSLLGLSLKWMRRNDDKEEEEEKVMSTHLTRGMPFGSMMYHNGNLPTILGGKLLASLPVVDDNALTKEEEWSCGELDTNGNIVSNNETKIISIQKEIRLHFEESDYSWIVFFSRPVSIQCFELPKDALMTGDAVAGGTPPSGGGAVGTPGVVVDTQFRMRVVSYDEVDDEEIPLMVRMALVDECTTGRSVMHAHCVDYYHELQVVYENDIVMFEKERKEKVEGYVDLLRRSVGLYAKNPKIEFEYDVGVDDDDDDVLVRFDWDAHKLEDVNYRDDDVDENDLLMYALPHHQQMLQTTNNNNHSTGNNNNTNTVLHQNQCKESFHGVTCLIQSSQWTLLEKPSIYYPNPSFRAPRPPRPEVIPLIIKSLAYDLDHDRMNSILGSNLKRGAMDTYFSGKILAKVGRVVLIASELKDLMRDAEKYSLIDGGEKVIVVVPEEYDDVTQEEYVDILRAVQNATELSSSSSSLSFLDDEVLDGVIDNMKKGVQVWFSEEAEAPHVYDASWGGLVNCGCRYVIPEGEEDETMGSCENVFPDCPALADVNKNFGNGFYNDHHFHYGYHIYAASIIAHYDPEWGREHFDEIMLYIRDIANPFPPSVDPYFTQYRHKDWFLGVSWASGIITAENSPHGRNQESSSEAIAAYEGVTMFGKVMSKIFQNDPKTIPQYHLSNQIYSTGRLLTSTEISAANRYYHINTHTTTTTSNQPPNKNNNSYPNLKNYAQPIVGMLYETMATFQTWFAPYDFVAYGIQLLPLTPACEKRDDVQWAMDVIPKYNAGCQRVSWYCVGNGWSIMLDGLLGLVGRIDEALKDVMEGGIPKEVYETEGGEGNSWSNTLWYIGTRKEV